MKWSRTHERMLSVLEVPLIQERKKGFSYYICWFCNRKPHYA